MKFLVITDDSKVTREDAFRAVDANQRWLEESRKEGKVEAIYSLAGNHGVAMIVDVDGPEALDELMIKMPAACEGTLLQIQALADYDVAMKALGSHVRSTLAAMKSGG